MSRRPVRREVLPMSATTKRLILAATAAIACQLVLSWLLSFIPGIDRTSTNTAFGLLQPIGYLVIALAMGVGGWLAGMRFLPVALAITLLISLGTLLVLAYANLPFGHASFWGNLAQGAKFYGLNVVVSLLAAALGTWAGTVWARKHPPRFAIPQGDASSVRR